MACSNDKPCLVKAGQGFSVLYNDRFLFSKYDPQRSFKRLLETTTFSSNTLFIICSPVLYFPVSLIKEKITSLTLHDCALLSIEKNVSLYNFSLELEEWKNRDLKEKIPLFYHLIEKPHQIASLIQIDFFDLSVFKRVVCIDASASVSLESDFYGQCKNYSHDVISNFWKNRMTLTRLGKLFTKNMLENTPFFFHSKKIIPHSVSKPILVLGTGVSLDDLLGDDEFLSIRSAVFIISVDASFLSLLQHGIVPDILVAVESQLAIEKAYIGCTSLLKKYCGVGGNPSRMLFFADLSSRPSLVRFFLGIDGKEDVCSEVSFFISEFSKDPFIKRIESFCEEISVFPPLGSVGLVALECAVLLRGVNVPIFVSGLDFSYPSFVTHAKGAPSFLSLQLRSSRLVMNTNPGAAFMEHAFLYKKRNGTPYYTDPVLSGYARLLFERYKRVPSLFSLAGESFPQGMPFVDIPSFFSFIASSKNECQLCFFENKNVSLFNNFIKEELNHIDTIKGLLTGKYAKDDEKLLKELCLCSYLYLHFPDGYKEARLDQDFLNRVRASIDFYEKILKKG